MKQSDRAFTLLVAKNEQLPLWEDGRKIGHPYKGSEWNIDVQFATLGEGRGDYKIQGYESQLFIERKGSLDEIAQNICHEENRMNREWMYASLADRAYLFVQGNPYRGDVPMYSRMNPDALRSYLKVLAGRGISPIWCDTREQMRTDMLDLCCHFIEGEFDKWYRCQQLAQDYPDFPRNFDPRKGDPREHPLRWTAQIGTEVLSQQTRFRMTLETVIKKIADFENRIEDLAKGK